MSYIYTRTGEVSSGVKNQDTDPSIAGIVPDLRSTITCAATCQNASKTPRAKSRGVGLSMELRAPRWCSSEYRQAPKTLDACAMIHFCTM